MPPEALVQNSEYLETHLLVVPKTMKKDFLKSYESLSPFTVPRSAQKVASDDEFNLYAVTTFKKYSAEFIHKCREHRWTPRDYKYEAGGDVKEEKEMMELSDEERRLYGEAVRLGRASYSEGTQIWMHVMALRAFVEAVLRYGLPMEYCFVLVEVSKFRHLGR